MFDISGTGTHPNSLDHARIHNAFPGAGRNARAAGMITRADCRWSSAETLCDPGVVQLFDGSLCRDIEQQPSGGGGQNEAFAFRVDKIDCIADR